MKLELAENIRRFRKQRSLTQEQLSEVLGVTVGAVHKWEAGLSVPELNLIVEMADFFDVSVDALLGYQMKDNGFEATVSRLCGYARSMDREALAEAEKALKRYPNSFDVVYCCAELYFAFSSVDKDKTHIRRSLELLEKARTLISQNADPHISECTICGDMAWCYVLLEEHEKALELMQKNNVHGIYSSEIGAHLAMMLGRADEAETYLSEALLNGMVMQVNTAMAFVFVFDARGDYASARDILLWELASMNGLKQGKKADFFDKISSEIYALLAYAYLKNGQEEEARDAIHRAKAFSLRFDFAPDFGVNALRFASDTEQSNIHDVFGRTAAEGIAYLLQRLADQAGLRLWEETVKNG